MATIFLAGALISTSLPDKSVIFIVCAPFLSVSVAGFSPQPIINADIISRTASPKAKTIVFLRILSPSIQVF
jgi:hypothetical protein